MNDDHFDGLVNDATHAVTNLIPDTVLDGLRDRERSDLLFQINDALTPILREGAERRLHAAADAAEAAAQAARAARGAE